MNEPSHASPRSSRSKTKATKSNPVEHDVVAPTPPPEPQIDRCVACTAKVLALSLLNGSECRVTFKLDFDAFPESIVTGVLDADNNTFVPEGALAEAFDRYHHVEDPETLEGKARYEWWACHLVDSWVEKAFASNILKPKAVWREVTE